MKIRSLFAIVIVTIFSIPMAISVMPEMAAATRIPDDYRWPDFVGVDFNADPASTLSDGKSKINLKLSAYRLKCGSDYSHTPWCGDDSEGTKEPFANEEFAISAVNNNEEEIGTETGVTYEYQGAFTKDKHGESAIFKTDSSGLLTFNITSTIPDAKRLVAYSRKSDTKGEQWVNVKFIDPNAPTPTNRVNTTSSSTSNAATTKPEITKLEVNGSAVNGKSINFRQDERIILKGHTVANGVVKLFIYSEPREASVTADKQGDWSYEVKGLSPGSHRVEAEVTDPATNQKSDRTVLIAFSIFQSPSVVELHQKTTSWWWIISVIGVFLAATLVWWLRWGKKWLKRKNSNIKPRGKEVNHKT